MRHPSSVGRAAPSLKSGPPSSVPETLVGLKEINDPFNNSYNRRNAAPKENQIEEPHFGLIQVEPVNAKRAQEYRK